MVSSTQVSSLPQLTTVARDLLTPVQNGTLIYNSTEGDVEYTVDLGGSWLSLASDLTSLQEAYTVGNSMALTAARPISISIPDATTPLFDVNNLLDGVDQQLVAYNLYRGKNQLGTPHTYATDEIRYRLNLTAPVNIDSGSRTMSVLQNSLMSQYLQLDGGFRQVRAFRDLSVEDALIQIVNTSTAVPTFRFYSNVNGSVGQTTLNLDHRARTDTGTLKTTDALRIVTTNEFNATFSQTAWLQAYSGNVNRTWLSYEGVTAAYNIFANSFNFQSEAGADPLFTVVDNTATGANVNAFQLQVKGLNSASTQIDWFRLQVEKFSQAAGAEGTRFGFYARGATLGAERLIFEYRGDDLTSNTGVMLMNSDMRMASRSLKEVGNFEAQFSGTFNQSQLGAGSFTVKSSTATPNFIVDYGSGNASARTDVNSGGNFNSTRLISASNLAATGHTLLVTLNDSVNTGQVVKVSPTVPFRFELMKQGDLADTPVAGMAVTSGVAGQNISILTLGTFRCQAEGSIALGDAIEKGNSVDGRVMSGSPGNRNDWDCLAVGSRWGFFNSYLQHGARINGNINNCICGKALMESFLLNGDVTTGYFRCPHYEAGSDDLIETYLYHFCGDEFTLIKVLKYGN